MAKPETAAATEVTPEVAEEGSPATPESAAPAKQALKARKPAPAPTPADKEPEVPAAPPSVALARKLGYKLAAPEGSLLDAKSLARIEAEAKAAGLTEEEALTRVDRELLTLTEYARGQMAGFRSEQERWKAAVMADAEVGGANYKEARSDADMFIRRFGTAELDKALEATGLLDHPEVVRIFARGGRAMRSDRMVFGGTGESRGPQTLKDALYGKK